MKHFIKDFSVTQTELIKRFAEHGIEMSKSRMSLYFKGSAELTLYQSSIIKTIEKEVFNDRKKAFSIYKSNLILTRKIKENESKRNSRV